MDALLEVVSKGNDFLWSFLLILLLCGTGVYYTVRLKFIQVRKFGEGCTLPKDCVTKTFIKSLRFYVSGNNLLTFSSFKLWDPEKAKGSSDGSGYQMCIRDRYRPWHLRQVNFRHSTLFHVLDEVRKIGRAHV